MNPARLGYVLALVGCLIVAPSKVAAVAYLILILGAGFVALTGTVVWLAIRRMFANLRKSFRS